MTIYRGPGGTGEARTDSDVTEVRIIADEAAGYKDQAATSASAAASSASAAATAETNAETAETNAETAEANAEAAQAAAEAAQAAAEAAQTAAEAAQTAAELAETNAETAEANAETAEANAETAQAAAEAALASAQAVYDNFDDRYLGSKTSNPTVDNDGNALLTGALYFNTVAPEMRVYNGTTWQNFSAASAVSSFNTRTGAITLTDTDVNTALGYTAADDSAVVKLTGNQTVAGTKTLSSNPILSAGTANGVPYLNGSKVVTSGSALTFDGSTLATTGALTVDGNTTLGNASTDTVTVNGYMGVGGAAASNVGIYARNAALTGTTQYGLLTDFTGSSASTAAIHATYSRAQTAAVAFTSPLVTAFYASNAIKGAGSTVTNQHGLYVADQTQGTNNYGITSLVSSGTDKWNIYASGTAQNYLRGNLGLRTETPEAQLDVYTPSGDTGLVVKRSTTMAAAPYIRLIPSSSVAYLDATGALGFRTAAIGGSPAEVMRINSSGNVGIGNSNPVERLEVVNASGAVTAKIWSATNTTPIASLELQRGTNATWGADAYGDYRIRNDAGALLFQYGESSVTTERMRIDSSGNVGIGTNAPSDYNVLGGTITAVAGSGISNLSIVSGASSTGNILFADGTTGDERRAGRIAYDHSVNNLYFFTNGNSLKATIDSSGNLGLGVTPSAWGSGNKAIQINGGAAYSSGADYGITANVYVDSGGTSRYMQSFAFGSKYYQYNGQHQWHTTSSTQGAGNAISFTQAMTLDASGRLLLGTTTAGSNQGLTVYNATQGEIRLQNSTTGNTAADGFQIAVSGSDALLYNRENANLIFGTNDTERARIDSSGNLLVGTTSQFNFGKQCIAFNGTNNYGISLKDTADQSGARFVGFINGSGTVIGAIDRVTTTNAVQYLTTSDYRQKENVQPMTGALAKVSALKPVTYTWKDGGFQDEGFIAHELQEVVPACVSGEKDAVDAEGNPKYQGIDTSFLVATLTAAIQEQQGIITALTARVEALESN